MMPVHTRVCGVPLKLAMACGQANRPLSGACYGLPTHRWHEECQQRANEMHFMTLIYKNVARRKERSFLTICGLSTAVASVVALVGISNGFGRSFNDVYQVHGVDLVVTRKGASDRLASSTDEAAAAKISEVKGVEYATGILLEAMSLEDEGIYGLATMGMPPNSRAFDDYKVVQGRGFALDDQKVLLVGSQLSSRLELSVGDNLSFFEGEEFEIVGVFESFNVWENGSLILPLAELQRLTDREEQVTFINVVLSGIPGQTEVDDAIASIEGIDGRLSAMPAKDFVATDSRIRIAGAMAWMTSSIALVIGAIGMLNTMMTSVFERTREIGILRAIGWKQSRVVCMIMTEACLMSVIAAIAGSLIGMAVTYGLCHVPSVAGTMTPYIDWKVFGQGFIIALVIALVGASYPAYRGSRMVPTEALRYE